MIAKCDKCGIEFIVTDRYVLGVLTGGIDCPKCDGTVNIIKG
jgi:hypothetical protein